MIEYVALIETHTKQAHHKQSIEVQQSHIVHPHTITISSLWSHLAQTSFLRPYILFHNHSVFLQHSVFGSSFLFSTTIVYTQARTSIFTNSWIRGAHSQDPERARKAEDGRVNSLDSLLKIKRNTRLLRETQPVQTVLMGLIASLSGQIPQCIGHTLGYCLFNPLHTSSSPVT